MIPPLSALMWEPSIAQSSMSRPPLARSSAAGPRAGAARRQPRSSPEADARPSPLSSPRCPRERRARRHRFAARVAHPQVLHGPERAVARDNVGAARAQAAAAEPRDPTDGPEQAQHAPAQPAAQDHPSTRPGTLLIQQVGPSTEGYVCRDGNQLVGRVADDRPGPRPVFTAAVSRASLRRARWPRRGAAHRPWSSRRPASRPASRTGTRG